MLSNLKYDCAVSVSDESDSVSSSCYSSDDEDNKRKFILGNNILYCNPLEIISVRQIIDSDELNENVNINTFKKSQGVHFDECFSDLEDEEVPESDEYNVGDVEEELYPCKSITDYELPMIDRFQPKMIKEVPGVSISHLNDIGEYCLREKSRRMLDKKEILSSELTSIENKQICSNSQSISQISKCTSNSIAPADVPYELLSTLSIDQLTEFIDSDKPLKEIVSKSKKKSSFNIQKFKKSKSRNNKNSKAMEQKCNAMNEIEKQLNSDNIQNENTHTEMEIECQLQPIIENETSKTLSDLDDNKLQTVQRFCNTKDFNQSSNFEVENDQYSAIELNPGSGVDSEKISMKMSVIEYHKHSQSQCDVNVDNVPMLSINMNVNDSSQDPLSIIDYSQPTLNLEFDVHNQSTALAKLHSITKFHNNSGVNKPLNVGNKSFYGIDCHVESTKVRSAVINSRKSQNFEIRSKKSQKNNSKLNSLSSSKSQSSVIISNNRQSVKQSENQNQSIIASDSLSTVNTHLITSNQSKSSIEHSMFLSPKSFTFIGNDDNNSKLNQNVIVNNQSDSSSNIIPQINDRSITTNSTLFTDSRVTTSINSMFITENQSVVTQNFTSNVSPPCKMNIEEDIKKTLLKSFNRIGRYNFMCDDIFQNETKSKNSSSDLTDNKLAIKSAYEGAALCNLSKFDNCSKESPTSSVDSGFNESFDNKQSDNGCYKSDVISDTSLVSDLDTNSQNDLRISQALLSVSDNSDNLHENIKTSNQIQSFQSNKNPLNNEDNLIKELNGDRTQLHSSDMFTKNKVYPFKQDYHSPCSSIRNREEISEFLNFQWLMFCEKHTLSNLI